MDFKELKTKAKPELLKLMEEQKEKLRDLRFKVANRKLKNMAEVKKVRILVARILTILNETK